MQELNLKDNVYLNIMVFIVYKSFFSGLGAANCRNSEFYYIPNSIERFGNIM